MISLCPMCRGRQVNNVHARISNGPCNYCGGRGSIDTRSVCKCGRPAVHLVDKIRVCTRFECGTAALEAKT